MLGNGSRDAPLYRVYAGAYESEQAAIEANGAVSAMIGPVLDMVDGAKSLGEIGEKIYELYPDLDSDEFQELLARAMFASSLAGYAAATDETEGE